MSLCLSVEELRELSGYYQRRKVNHWLRKNGFSFRLARNGWARVDREHYHEVMRGRVLPKQTEPNYGAIR